MFAQPGSSSNKPSQVAAVCEEEHLRQLRELVLIPSESICFPEVAELVASDFGNIYAEGQPNPRLSRLPEALANDGPMFHAWHRRLSDGRFYRGCMKADRIELLAKGNIAKVFALLEGSPDADAIHVNVQALSGAPANLGVYTALLNPGDVLMGLNLSHGGHLSHGSPFNVSGKQYRVYSYGVDELAEGKDRVLNYDKIQEMAMEHRPRMIVGGSSAYPWDWDWKRLRAIADECGALLLADVAHLAGLVVAGVANNPLPYADIVTFTTHKTLCGPRGAAIVTRCHKTAKKIDNAVFPGLQGGPHMNAIAGIGRLFEIILEDRAAYVKLQQQIIDDSAYLCECLQEVGFKIEYGGTNTHLFLIDLKLFKTRDGGSLDGETASRLLENVGIICNKNTLPGDKDASASSGIRFGTPWLTQRGITQTQLKELARIVHHVLSSTQSCSVYVPTGEERCRARLPFEIIQEGKKDTLAIAKALPYPKWPEDNSTDAAPEVGDRVALLIRGEKARLALEESSTCDVLGLKIGQTAHGFLLRETGACLDDVGITYLGHQDNLACGPNGEDQFVLLPHKDKAGLVQDWLGALSDGYILAVPNDPQCKVDGPIIIEPLAADKLTSAIKEAAGNLPTDVSFEKPAAGMILASKSFFVGQKAILKQLSVEPKPEFNYAPPEDELKKTILNEWHKNAGAKMVPFGGWEMPVEYPGGIFEEHAAVRSAAGLFDVSHMSALDFKGPHALPFLENIFANCVSRLVDGEAHYSYILRPDGTALDDLYVYRIAAEHFMVVVNAGNAPQDIAWLEAVNSGSVLIDQSQPGKRLPGPTVIRDLRNAGADSRLDLALQGPLSATILMELAGNEKEKLAIDSSKLNDILNISLNGIEVLAARTGYTGEELGFELFVHPDRAIELWELLLETGKSRGVRPAGLGARDSLRIEAGFPLFGHELEGPETLSLTEADYGFVSRFHVPFYIGREAYMERLAPRKKRLLRLKGSGRKTVRAGQAILDDKGQVVGAVTSFAFNNPGFDFHVIAAVKNDFRPARGSKITAFRGTPEQVKGELDQRKLVELSLLTRFPSAEDKSGWKGEYAEDK